MPSRHSWELYAQYKSADYESSIAAAKRFIRLHPQHPNVDYAFYVKGLCEIAQDSSYFANFVPTDNSRRDIGTARDAFATLTELLSRFPDSPYAADSRIRLVNLRNQLARSEIHVANYYFSRVLWWLQLTGESMLLKIFNNLQQFLMV